MRVLLIPMDWHRHNEDKDLFSDMLHEFNVQTEGAMIYQGNLQEAIDFKPTLVFFQASMSLEDLQKIKDETKATITMWTGDCAYAPSQAFMSYQSVVDVYFVPFYGEILNRFMQILQKPVKYIFEPIQNWRFKEPKEMNGGRIVFVGNEYETLSGGESRVKTLTYLKKHVPELEIYGNIQMSNGTINYKEVPQLYNDAFLVICENNIHNVEGYFTPRNIGAMSAGSCPLSKHFNRIEYCFSDSIDTFVYKDEYELLELINFLKREPQTRNYIAKNAYKRVKECFEMKDFVYAYIRKTYI